MSRNRKKPETGWSGERVAKGIFHRPGGTYHVAISVKNQMRKKSFPTLEAAISWRDDQISSRPQRAFSAGINALHRSTWSPKDMRDDYDEIRRQIEKAPRTTETINGREFTVVHIPALGVAA